MLMSKKLTFFVSFLVIKNGNKYSLWTDTIVFPKYGHMEEKA